MLNIKNLSKTLGQTTILQNINLSVHKGDFLVIMGPSGCGKTTLLYQMGGLDYPSRGEISFKKQSLQTLSEKSLSKLRLESFGFVFQKTPFLKNLSLIDNIVLPALQLKKESKTTIYGRAKNLLDKMGIRQLSNSDIREISGGQLQRAGICRAMINQPELLFADEPTGALNSKISQKVMESFKEINKKGVTIVLVTHDSKVAAYANRIVFMKDDKILTELENIKKQKQDIQNDIDNIIRSVGI